MSLASLRRFAVALPLTAFAACGSSTSTTTAGQPVEVVASDSLTFSPATLTVPAGTTIRWRNSGTFPHTVTSGVSSAAADSPGTLFDSQLGVGSTYQFTLTKVGEQAYFCRYHEAMGMKATITVTTPPPSPTGGGYGY